MHMDVAHPELYQRLVVLLRVVMPHRKRPEAMPEHHDSGRLTVLPDEHPGETDVVAVGDVCRGEPALQERMHKLLIAHTSFSPSVLLH